VPDEISATRKLAAILNAGGFLGWTEFFIGLLLAVLH
jgi:hypothetical protein